MNLRKNLNKEFYLSPELLNIAKALLGKHLMARSADGFLQGGMIVETEAYCGITDRASHAFGGRRTQRTEVMYHEGGVAYVYISRGVHFMLNIVTNKKDVPHVVLIRAIEPTDGIEFMLNRRNVDKLKREVAGGPGRLTQALGINLSHNGCSLLNGDIWIEDRGVKLGAHQIISGPRIGVESCGEAAQFTWRFWIKDNYWISR